jgi:hypothetical protein
MPIKRQRKPLKRPHRQKPNPARQLLRHAVATLAYRAGKAFRRAPESFADFRIGEKTRTPAQIVAHLGDLFDWALSLARGKHHWRESPVLSWDSGIERFFAALGAFDDHLASRKPLGFPPEKLFQGPVADALTHVGQISMLRRLAGSPVKGENYFRAEILAGRVGPDQSPPAFEFD